MNMMQLSSSDVKSRLKTSFETAMLSALPVSQKSPVNPEAHRQRYPFIVKPVWQVAWFLQVLFKHASLHKYRKA